MRRAICFCEPNLVQAGEVNTWKFIYTTATNLPKGTKLRFDIGSQGRAIDWETPRADLKKGKNLIYALMEKGKTQHILQGKEVHIPNSIIPVFDFILPSEVAAGAKSHLSSELLKVKKKEKLTLAHVRKQMHREDAPSISSLIVRVKTIMTNLRSFP